MVLFINPSIRNCGSDDDDEEEEEEEEEEEAIIHSSIHLSICPSINPSNHLSIHGPFIHHLSIHPSINPYKMTLWKISKGACPFKISIYMKIRLYCQNVIKRRI